MSSTSLTLLLLALCCAALLLVRRSWASFSTRTRRLGISAAIFAIALFLIGRATGWVTSSDRLNCAAFWAAILGYLLLLTLLSLNHPRWLTSASAIILAIPILGASIFLPLAGIFYPPPRRLQPLGEHLYVSWQEYAVRGTPSSGVDLEILYRPPLLPFLQHSRLAGRFYNQHCNAVATEVVLQPDHNSVFVRCPSWPNTSGNNPGDLLRLHP